MKKKTMLYIRTATKIVEQGGCNDMFACRDCPVHGKLIGNHYTCKAISYRSKLWRAEVYLSTFTSEAIFEALM